MRIKVKLKIIVLLALLNCMVGSSALSQTLQWTGNTDTNFFNEANWVVLGTVNNPSEGAVDPGVPLAYSLELTGVTLDISGQGMLSFTSGEFGISLNNATLSADGITNGVTTLENRATLILKGENPLGDNLTLNIIDPKSWIKLTAMGAQNFRDMHAGKIQISGIPSTIDIDLRVNQYYDKGTLLRKLDTNHTPLMLYDDKGQSGTSFAIKEFTIYKRTQLGSFENLTSSFLLERGYVASVAIFQDGTGKSQVYIANEEDLAIDLPFAMDNNISFVRVMPWNWVTKKGASGFKNVGTTWTYNWGSGSQSLPETEFAPMAWGGGNATPSAVATAIQKKNVTHWLGFNESDNCNDQSGQYGGLCQIDVAVPLFENLMGIGLRLVSPSPREEGPFGWLKNFRDAARQEDVRYDVLGVHWYDWGSNPSNTQFEDATRIFNRFKNYLQKVYDEHKLPIWITEFNANPFRDSSVHIAFIKLALPYLESLEYVERYCYFEPVLKEGVNAARYFDEQGNLTPFGQIYTNIQSTPSVPEPTWSTPTFLTDMNSKIPIKLNVSTDILNEGEVMTISVSTSRNVGSPQKVKVLLQGVGTEEYAIQAVELTIPEGGNTASTLLQAIDDPDVEDPATVTVQLEPVTDGIEWDGVNGSFSLVSEDEIVLSTNEVRQLHFYPNPANGMVYLGDDLPASSVIQAISSDGRRQILSQKDLRSVDISSLAPGMYVVSIINPNGVTARGKLLIQ